MAKSKTEVVPAKTNLPATIRTQLAAEADELAKKINAPGGDKIKLTKKKTFRLPDGSEHSGPLSVVILDFASMNKYYDRPYKEGEVSPPACYALGWEARGLAPSKKAPDIQSDVGCDKCTLNQFGSKGDGKACGNHRVLAVVAGLGDMAGDSQSPMWILEVSPTAIKAFDAYVATVRTQFNVPPIGVITDVFFDPSSEYQSLRFGNPLPNPNLELHFGRRPSARERLMVEPDVSGYAAPKKAKK